MGRKKRMHIDKRDPLWIALRAGKIRNQVDRDILKLHYRDGLPMSRIAKKVGMNVYYVRKLITTFWYYCAWKGDQYEKLRKKTNEN